MSDTEPQIRPLPAADADALTALCAEMLDWVGGIEMPEERVGLREAAGNLGGILVGLMTSRQVCFYTEEAANVAELCGHLRDTEEQADRARVLGAICECAGEARDAGTDILIEFR